MTLKNWSGFGILVLASSLGGLYYFQTRKDIKVVFADPLELCGFCAWVTDLSSKPPNLPVNWDSYTFRFHKDTPARPLTDLFKLGNFEMNDQPDMTEGCRKLLKFDCKAPDAADVLY